MKKLLPFFAMFIAVMAIVGGTVVMTSATSPKTTITLQNKTTFNIDEIYLSPDEENDWGHDILDPDEVLTPGEKVAVSISHDGLWDVKLVAQDGSTCEIENVNLESAKLWLITASCGK